MEAIHDGTGKVLIGKNFSMQNEDVIGGGTPHPLENLS